MRASYIATLLLALASGAAIAGTDLEVQLAEYESEARALAANLPGHDTLAAQSGQRRLVEAQLAFALGEYETASLSMFELSGKLQGADRERALYVLAESLYQKGDRAAARGAFADLLKVAGKTSRYLVPTIVRTIEIAIADDDVASGEQAMAQLAGVAPALRGPSVPYVQGKWAFARGRYDEALGLFATVPRGSDLELQAVYYAGTAHVAKKDLAKATELFTEVATRRPRTNLDRRVIELSQLALGRLHYERDQPAKSIEAYLLVDRHSDLFLTALYEVAWVYVKSQQYDKAIVALDLLGRLDDSSMQSPQVKNIEGNLRIRLAQQLHQAKVPTAATADDAGDPATEYAKADQVFTATHDRYLPPFLALERMQQGRFDAAALLDQLGDRGQRRLAVTIPMPEVAASWLREEPDVRRLLSADGDLAQIARHVREVESSIERMEGALASGDRLRLFPALSARRARIAAIQHELVGIRARLADQAGEASPQRTSLLARYTALGIPEEAHGMRLAASREAYDKVGERAREVEEALMETQAIAVALQAHALSGQLAAAQRESLQTRVDAVTKDTRAIERELQALDDEIALARDLEPFRDLELRAGRALRRQVIAAQNAEHRRFAGRSKLADQAARLASQLEQTDAQLDGLIARGASQLKAQLTRERQELAGYKRMLAEYEAEARAIGAEVLTAGFHTIKDKLYDVVIRADVGSVDVAWSQQENNEDELKRLGVARTRDVKQLRDEFRFVLDEKTGRQTDSRPPAPSTSPGPPASGPVSPGGSR